MTAVRRFRDHVGRWPLRRRIAAGLAVLAAGLLVAAWAVWVRPVQIRQALVDAGVTPTISFHRPWYLRWLPRKAAAYLPDGAVTRVTGVSLDPWAEGRDLSAKTLSRIRSAGALEHLDLPDAGLDDVELADLLDTLPSLRTVVLDGNPLTTASLRRLERSGLASISVDCPAIPTDAILTAVRGNGSRFDATILARLRRFEAEPIEDDPPGGVVVSSWHSLPSGRFAVEPAHRWVGMPPPVALVFETPVSDDVNRLLGGLRFCTDLSASGEVAWDRLSVNVQDRLTVDRLTQPLADAMDRTGTPTSLDVREGVDDPADLSLLSCPPLRTLRLTIRPDQTDAVFRSLPRELVTLEVRCDEPGPATAEVDFSEFKRLSELKLDGVPLTTRSFQTLATRPPMPSLELRNLPQVPAADIAAALLNLTPRQLSLGPGVEIDAAVLDAITRVGPYWMMLHEDALPSPEVLRAVFPWGNRSIRITPRESSAAGVLSLDEYVRRAEAAAAR